MATTDLKVWNEILAMYGPMSNGDGKTPSNLTMDDLIRAQKEMQRKLGLSDAVEARTREALKKLADDLERDVVRGCEVPAPPFVRRGRCAWCGGRRDNSGSLIEYWLRHPNEMAIVIVDVHPRCRDNLRGATPQSTAGRSRFLDSQQGQATPPRAPTPTSPAATAPQVKCACGCNEFVTPSLRWGAYAGAAHMMRAARLAEREAFGADAPPLKLLSEKDPKASRELELIDTIAATKTAADNQIGSLNDALAEKERRIRELERAVFRPVDYSTPMGRAPVDGMHKLRVRVRYADIPVEERLAARLRESGGPFSGSDAVARAPAYTHPRAIRALPMMAGGGFRAPRPVTIACQSEDDFPFAYVED